MPANPNPFQQHAEDIGRFLAQERAREDARAHREESCEGPSENTD